MSQFGYIAGDFQSKIEPACTMICSVNVSSNQMNLDIFLPAM